MLHIMTNEKRTREEIQKKEKELQQQAEQEAILMKADENRREMVNIITGWVTSNGSMYELYTRIRDLNISKGYETA